MTYNFTSWDERRILAAADTAAYEMSGRLRCFTSKIAYLPHIGCVFVSQGEATFLARLIFAISMTSLPNGLDDLVAVFQRTALREWEANNAALVAAGLHVVPEYFEQFPLLIGGWSRADQRMRVYQCDYHAGRGEHFSPVEGARSWTTSNPDYDLGGPYNIGRPKKVQVPGTIIASAVHWKRVCEENPDAHSIPGISIGGELTLYELTRHKCEIRTIHTFPDRDAMASQMVAGTGEWPDFAAPAAEVGTC